MADDFNEHGYVVLRQAISHASLEALGHELDQLLLVRLRIRDSWLRYAMILKFVGIGPPKTPASVFPDIVANPLIETAVAAILGGPIKNTYYTGNANLAGSISQQVHRDCPFYYGRCVAVLAAIYFEDVSFSNGMTEVWPGSHQDNHAIEFFSLRRRRIYSAPVQPALKKGDLLLYDPRLWHRGMTNYSARARHLLQLKYELASSQTPVMTFANGCEPAFRDSLSMQPSFSDQTTADMFIGRKPDRSMLWADWLIRMHLHLPLKTLVSFCRSISTRISGRAANL